jgi:hypothetical protein
MSKKIVTCEYLFIYLFAFHQKPKEEKFERLKRVQNYDLHEIICFPAQKTEASM